MDPREQAAYYLAGIIDGEGYIKLRRGVAGGRTREAWSRRLEITNTDPGIIRASCEALEILGVSYSLRDRKVPANQRPAWSINVYGRDNYEKMRDLPLRGTKRQRLAELVDSYAAPPIPTREEVLALIARYGTERAIATAAGVTKSSVQHWKRAHGIESDRILPVPSADELREMLAEHGSERRAAMATGHARKTIRRCRRLHNVPL